jgi:hypothetical protein
MGYVAIAIVALALVAFAGVMMIVLAYEILNLVQRAQPLHVARAKQIRADGAIVRGASLGSALAPDGFAAHPGPCFPNDGCKPEG